MQQATIKAIAPWFGGKRTLAPRIVAELGPHAAYFEPFCGSMAVLFAKEPSQQETCNDLHGAVIALARVLADRDGATALYERALRTLSCTALYEESRAWLDAVDPAVWDEPVGPRLIEAAGHWLMVCWQGINGTAGCVRSPFRPSIRFTPGGGSSAGRWAAVAESIPAWHARLRRVAILGMDAIDLLGKIDDDPRVAIYADPPYIAETRANHAGESGRYLHDFEPADHRRLAEALGRFRRARVVVSYYDHPSLADLYAGWTKIECTMQKNLHVQNRRGVGRCEAQEVLLVHGPSFTANAGSKMLF